jgi:PAS domain S-box-containing protein
MTSSSSRELRTRAENAVRMTRRDVAALQNQDVQRLVYELQVHQIEVEMQNESLRSAQHDIEKLHEQYQELFDCAPVAYLMLDASGAIVRANTAAVMLIGDNRSRLIGQRLSAFFANEDVLALQQHLRSAQSNTRALTELRLKPVNGLHIHVRMDTSVIPSLEDTWLIVLTDISERKRSVEALERLNAELESRVATRTAELETRNHQLEAEILVRTRSETYRMSLETKLREVQRLESLGTLAAGIAHDFNNLLVGVLGNSDLMLLAPELPERFREPLAQIKQAGRRAADLTRQMLMFAGRGHPILAKVSLPLVITDGFESVRGRVADRIELQAQIDPDIPVIEADRGQLHQVIVNILNNAIEAMNGPGAITVRVSAEQLSASALAEFQYPGDASPGNFVVLQVQDTGPGIAAEIITRIFDPFFTTKFTGRGLGLATVFGIVHSHRGAIRVRTPAGGGTSFEIAFPAAAVKRESERPRRLSEPGWSRTGSVLLIDDDDLVRSVVAQLLTALGYTVTAADGGEAGLKLFGSANPRFDLVVVDWQMPGLSGEQVLKLLREVDAELPLILISGYSTDDLASNDPHLIRLQKPMTLAQLQEAVRVVTDEKVVKSRHVAHLQH